METNRIEYKEKLTDGLEKEVVAFLNAIAHNDYSSGDTPIFEIFSDRFEITTYGGLVEGLSTEEFFTGVSKPRNREIMRIFKDLEYVERLGSGIPYIVNKYGRDIYNFMPSVVRFSLPYSPASIKSIKLADNKQDKMDTTGGITGGITSGITQSQLSVLNLIKSDERISISKIAEKLKINRSAVQKHIEKLKEIGVLQRKGATFGGKWVIKKLNKKLWQ
jgi:predicted HTH transcriptional regulator